MKEASFCKRLSFMALLIILAVAGAVPTFATDSVINETQKGSLTLFKYDYTAIQEDGVDVSDLNANANWQKSTEAEKRLVRAEIPIYKESNFILFVNKGTGFRKEVCVDGMSTEEQFKLIHYYSDNYETSYSPYTKNVLVEVKPAEYKDVWVED